jgi:hypothetical protein
MIGWYIVSQNNFNKAKPQGVMHFYLAINYSLQAMGK